MSVQTQINRIKTNINAAYTAISERGGTTPSDRSSANLANAIKTIPWSSSPGDSIWTYKTITNSTAATNGFYSVCYGGGKFVAVPLTGNIAAYSIDGLTWNYTTMPETNGYGSVCYGNGKFVAIGYYNSSSGKRLAYSDDGVIWTKGTITSAQFRSVCYGNGLFVAVNNSLNNIYYSSDGTKWTTVSLENSRYLNSVCYGNGKFVAVSSSNQVAFYSDNGMSWTQVLLPASGAYSSVCYGNGLFVATRYGISTSEPLSPIYSSNGISWYYGVLDSIVNGQISITYGNGKFVVVTYGSDQVLYSLNGIDWEISTRSLPFISNWHSICYGDGKFVAVADGGKYIASSS